MFALKMYVADMKRILRHFWWLAPIFLVLIVVAPFHDAQMYAFTYLIMMTIFLFVPSFSRIHFVVPVDDKQIKQFFLWRIVIVCGMMLLCVGAVIGISEWKNLEWSKGGIHWVAFYLVIYLLCSEMSLQSLGIKYKFNIRHVIGIIVGIMSMFFAMGVLTEYMPLKWGACLSFSMVIISAVNMFLYLKCIKVEDYTYVPRGIWGNDKVERD